MWRESRCLYAIKVCESPFIQQKGKGIAPYDPQFFMVFSLGVCFANMEVGACRTCFQTHAFEAARLSAIVAHFLLFGELFS